MEVLRAESITAMLVDAKLNAADPIQPPTKLLRLLMTVPQEDVPQHKLVEMGFACSIVKPVRPGLLVQAIAALLSSTTLPAKAAAVDASKAKQKGGRILLAEDNQINQIVATDLLSNAGYTINVVGDGQSAVHALRDGHYDLILMDCQMPVMDGLDATRVIRQAEQRVMDGGKPMRRTPIIALTANASNVDRARCADAGMDGYCPKPFRPKELLDMVAQFLAEAPAVESPVEVAPPTIGDDSPLRLETLLESCTQNSGLAVKILEKFQKQVADVGPQFQSMVQAGNVAELARLSHLLKGTAGVIGAGTLRLQLAEMEAIARSADLENADKQLAELSREIDRCLACIPQMILQLRENAQPVGSG